MNSSPPKIRVMVVDDHPVIRRGLTAFLRVVPDLELACEAANGSRALAMLAQSAPDVILMDMVMPEMNGVQTIFTRPAAPRQSPLPLTTIYWTDGPLPFSTAKPVIRHNSPADFSFRAP